MSRQRRQDHQSFLFEERFEYRVDRVFAPLCATIPPDQIPELQKQVRGHVDRVRRSLERNEFLDVATAERIAEILAQLLDTYESYPTDHQALIAGAARYFVQSQDAEPDTASLLGFDDDVTVLNHVLEQIGLGEQKLEL